MMKQLERISAMEQALDDSAAAVSALSASLEAYLAVRGRLLTLTTYYESDLWRQDYEDDCAGKLPSGLKRGVLSEDAVYNLLSDHDRLTKELKDLVRDLQPE